MAQPSPTDPVGPHERLFRSVGPSDCGTDGGKLFVSSTAFQDREREPSVNRAAIWPEAEKAKQEPGSGVVVLVAADVRGIVVTSNPDGQPAVQHRSDVRPAPIESSDPGAPPPNPSHAVLHQIPPGSKGANSRWRHQLANLVAPGSFLIVPDGLQG